MKQNYYKFPVVALSVILIIKLAALAFSYVSLASISSRVAMSVKVSPGDVFSLFSLSQIFLLLVYIITYIKLRRIYVNVRHVRLQVICCLIAFLLIPVINFTGFLIVRILHVPAADNYDSSFFFLISQYLFALFLFAGIVCMIVIVKNSFSYIQSDVSVESESGYLDEITV